MSADPDRASACFALSSPVMGALRCRLDVYHRGGHEALLGNGSVYVWWDEKDTTTHWKSPCEECGAPLENHRALGDTCPSGSGRFRGRAPRDAVAIPP